MTAASFRHDATIDSGRIAHDVLSIHKRIVGMAQVMNPSGDGATGASTAMDIMGPPGLYRI